MRHDLNLMISSPFGMTRVLSGCAGAGPHNSVKHMQCHSDQKMGKVLLHTGEKKTWKLYGIPTDYHNFLVLSTYIFSKTIEKSCSFIEQL